MSLKVGQKVRLKSLEVCGGMEDSSRVGVALVMHKHFGTIVTITSFDSEGDVSIKEDFYEFWWSPEWFGEIPTINLKDIV